MFLARMGAISLLASLSWAAPQIPTPSFVIAPGQSLSVPGGDTMTVSAVDFDVNDAGEFLVALNKTGGPGGGDAIWNGTDFIRFANQQFAPTNEPPSTSALNDSFASTNVRIDATGRGFHLFRLQQNAEWVLVVNEPTAPFASTVLLHARGNGNVTVPETPVLQFGFSQNSYLNTLTAFDLADGDVPGEAHLIVSGTVSEFDNGSQSFEDIDVAIKVTVDANLQTTLSMVLREGQVFPGTTCPSPAGSNSLESLERNEPFLAVNGKGDTLLRGEICNNEEVLFLNGEVLYSDFGPALDPVAAGMGENLTIRERGHDINDCGELLAYLDVDGVGGLGSAFVRILDPLTGRYEIINEIGQTAVPWGNPAGDAVLPAPDALRSVRLDADAGMQWLTGPVNGAQTEDAILRNNMVLIQAGVDQVGGLTVSNFVPNTIDGFAFSPNGRNFMFRAHFGGQTTAGLALGTGYDFWASSDYPKLDAGCAQNLPRISLTPASLAIPGESIFFRFRHPQQAPLCSMICFLGFTTNPLAGCGVTAYGSQLYLPTLNTIGMPVAASGTAFALGTVEVAIPNSTALIGVTGYFQSLFFLSNASQMIPGCLGTSFSNVLAVRIGEL